MLRAESLVKFRLITRSEFEGHVVEALARFGFIHINRPTLRPEDFVPQPIRYFISKRGLVNDEDLVRLLKSLKAFCSVIDINCNDAYVIINELLNLKECLECLKFLRELGIELKNMGKELYITLHAGTIPVNMLKNLIGRIRSLGAIVKFKNLGSKYLVVITGLKNIEDDILEVLKESLFKEVPIRRYYGVGTEEGIKECEERIKELTNELLSKLKELIKESQIFRGSRLIVINTFLNYVRELKELLENMKKTMEKLGYEPPKEVLDTLRSTPTAEVISLDELVIITSDLRDKLNYFKSRYEELRKYLRPSKPPKLKVTNYTAEEVLKELNKVKEFVESINEFHRCIKELLNLSIEASKYYLRVAKYVAFAETLKYLKDKMLYTRIYRRSYIVIAEGWLPKHLVNSFRATVSKLIPKIISLNFTEPEPWDKPPVLLKHVGILKYLSKLTFMRGVPSYWEVDPTLFFTILFIVMYGMMFGDLGLGPIIAITGYVLYKVRKPFLGFSSEGTAAIGFLLMFCGISSTLFGLAYGVAFLSEIMKPLLLSPLHNVMHLIKLSIIFGITQIITGVIINIINNLIIRDYYGALLSSKGLAALAYYISGITLVYVLIKNGLKLGTVLSGTNLALLLLTLGSALTVFTAPLIRGYLESRKFNRSYFEEGLAELIELLIGYLANTISYVRLAAFALAHEALGLAANALSHLMGYVPSFIAMNTIALLLEGLVVGIQALRLVYYEFSTKFYRGDGALFRPVLILHS